MSSHRLGLVAATLVLLAWGLAIRYAEAALGSAGLLLCLPLGLLGGLAILAILLATRPPWPGLAPLTVRLVGFAAGFSLGHELVRALLAPGLPGAAAEAAGAAALGRDLAPFVHLPLELVGPVLLGLWGALLLGLLDRPLRDLEPPPREAPPAGEPGAPYGA